jgi:hypothetical protein
VAGALIDYMLQLPGNGAVPSINPLVAETFDGSLYGIRVQTNVGGVLTINGAPAGRELGRSFLWQVLEPPEELSPGMSNLRTGCQMEVDSWIQDLFSIA